MGLAGGLNAYGFSNGDPVNFSDPFGLCPRDAGGDGKTEGFADCPKRSSGYYANEDQQGRGGVVNDAKGAAASCGENGWCSGLAATGAFIVGGWAVEGVGALVGAVEGGEVAGTVHGAMRMADASRLGAEGVKDVMANATRVGVQRDGARVFVQEVGGKFNVVVHGERGVITTLKTISEKSLVRLGNRYGWTF